MNFSMEVAPDGAYLRFRDGRFLCQASAKKNTMNKGQWISIVLFLLIGAAWISSITWLTKTRDSFLS